MKLAVTGATGFVGSHLLDEKGRSKLLKTLEKATGAQVFPISAPLNEGIDPLLDKLVETLGSPAEPEREEAEAERRWSPL